MTILLYNFDFLYNNPKRRNYRQIASFFYTVLFTLFWLWRLYTEVMMNLWVTKTFAFDIFQQYVAAILIPPLRTFHVP